jgi:hypothetical protein
MGTADRAHTPSHSCDKSHLEHDELTSSETYQSEKSAHGQAGRRSLGTTLQTAAPPTCTHLKRPS